MKTDKSRSRAKPVETRARSLAEAKVLRAALESEKVDAPTRKTSPGTSPDQAHKPRPTVRKRSSSSAAGDLIGAADLARRVGQRLRDERVARDLSLDDLSRSSGVSRAALSQIETCKSSPSISVMWKIAVGLGIPFAELLGEDRNECSVLRRADAQVLRSPDGRFESRPVVPAGTTPWVEVYELRLTARSENRSEAHAAGTREVLLVLSGSLSIELGSKSFELEAGDSIGFRADQPHTYRNSGLSEARAHNVIIYSRN